MESNLKSRTRSKLIVKCFKAPRETRTIIRFYNGFFPGQYTLFGIRWKSYETLHTAPFRISWTEHVWSTFNIKKRRRFSYLPIQFTAKSCTKENVWIIAREKRFERSRFTQEFVETYAWFLETLTKTETLISINRFSLC